MLFPTICTFCGSCWLSYTSQRLHHGTQFCNKICLWYRWFLFTSYL